jgi:hypothetical protein
MIEQRQRSAGVGNSRWYSMLSFEDNRDSRETGRRLPRAPAPVSSSRARAVGESPRGFDRKQGFERQDHGDFA